MRENDGRSSMFRPENLAAFAACYAAPPAWREPGASPLFGRLDDLPPLHIQVGAEELLRDDAVRLHERVRSVGGLSDLSIYDGVFHGWHMLDGLVPEARRALEQAAVFIRSDPATMTQPLSGDV